MFESDSTSLFIDPNLTKDELAAVCHRKIGSACQQLATQEVDEIPSEAIARLWEIANRNTKLSILYVFLEGLSNKST